MKVPESIGVIIDGNRRWAKGKGKPSLEGHRAGFAKLKECFLWAKEKEIKNAIVYAFSTENWKRSEEEVSYLFDLLRQAFSEEKKFWQDENIKLRFIGQRERLSEDLQKSLSEAEEETKGNSAFTAVIAISYGGRAEILEAARKFTRAPKEVQDNIDENSFNQFLWTTNIPDPDLVIRTGGEKRLSNFLLWQITYSELFFSDTLWPDFSKEEFLKILEEFGERDRRHGK